MSKKIKYRFIRKNDIIDSGVAFRQVVALLNKVTENAQAVGDNKMLLKVADRWIKIGSMLSDDGEKEYVDTNVKTKYGFCPGEGSDDS
jgi:hypothetical protein